MSFSANRPRKRRSSFQNKSRSSSSLWFLGHNAFLLPGGEGRTIKFSSSILWAGLEQARPRFSPKGEKKSWRRRKLQSAENRPKKILVFTFLAWKKSGGRKEGRRGKMKDFFQRNEEKSSFLLPISYRLSKFYLTLFEVEKRFFVGRKERKRGRDKKFAAELDIAAAAARPSL